MINKKGFKKILSLILVFIFILGNTSIASAYSIKIVSKETQLQNQKEIKLSDMFIFFGKMYDDKIPESYKYIKLNFKIIGDNDELHENLQKLVYVDVLKNNPVSINVNKHINAYAFYKFAEKNYKINLINDGEINSLKLRNANFGDLEKIKDKIKIAKNNFELDNEINSLNYKKEVFKDVYKTITTKHYNREKLDKIEILNEATKGLAKGTKDKYTVYFPPVDNKNFKEALSGEYEGIGSYVDMETPGELKIISPISGSPAEKAGLKGGDIVLKVDSKEITEKTSLGEAVSWIKGPAGTEVVLTIKRGNKIFDVKVKREKIILKEIEFKKLNYSTFYIKMKFFGPNIASEFKEALKELKKDKNIKKVIFDLRGDGGGYLDQVSDILSNFVPAGEATAVVKYHDYKTSYKSKGYNLVDFSKYKLVILENGGTASASEIFIGTLKDYFPKTTIIGEKSYGKGSVQTMKSYRDGSSLKYTIAKWFTGKTETGIDGIGISPDIEIKMEKYGVSEDKDIQLKKALQIR